jgi:tetratricopeptide (TPR) repeat protein
MSNEVREWLDTLEQREVVTRRGESKFPGEREYAFRHALVRDVAYAMLTEHDRVLGHRLAAGWLERVGTRDSVLLAESFERGGMHENAVEWWLAAAHDALDASDFEAAIARSERGLALGAKARAPALELVRGEALRVKGDVALAAASIERALAAFPAGSLGFCNAAGEYALVLQRLGRVKDLGDAASRLASVAEAVEIADALALARVRTALALLRVGERAAARKLVALVDRGSALPGPVTRAFRHAFFAIEALLDNNPSHYLAEARTALAYHEEVGDARLALEQSINIGSVYLELGAYEDAERLLRDGLANAERLNLQHAMAGAQHNLGLVLAHLGRFEDAIVLERQALEALRGKDRRLEGGALLSMAVIHELAGELAIAEEEAREAIALLREAAPPLVPRALGTLASICLASVDLRGARDAADEAAALLAAGGVESGENLIRRVEIEALAASGERDRARALLAVAWDRLSSQAARLSGEELRQSFLTRVPDNARIVALREAWKD